MNVRVCTFPTGEDPDSFARQNTLEELTLYLEENSKDFIRFKASLLVEEAQNDPIKKADTIREIIQSISKIPDRIKREIYVQECARIMDISEEVLFSTLAQLNQKGLQDLNKEYLKEQKAFEVIKPEKQTKRVDVQYELERKIIEILLLYGHRTEDFEDLILKENELGELELEPVVQSAKVFQKVYLDLQEDEMMFGNELFRDLYYTIIDTLNQNPETSLDSLVNSVSPELSAEITSILMEEERYHLHKWEEKNIYPKGKEITIPQLVTETILTLRCFLIDQKVREYQNETLENKNEINRETLEEVKNYSGLKMLLSRRLSRAL